MKTFAALSIRTDDDGTLLIATPDGHEEIFDQTYDDMFRWKKVTTETLSQVYAHSETHDVTRSSP